MLHYLIKLCPINKCDDDDDDDDDEEGDGNDDFFYVPIAQASCRGLLKAKK